MTTPQPAADKPKPYSLSPESNALFRQELKALAIPFTIQKLVTDSFVLIDMLMIGGMGDEAIAAVAAAGQFTFLLSMILSAVYGISVYITQYYGTGDMKGVKSTLGLMLISAVAASLVAFIIIRCFGGFMLQAFLQDELALQYATQYTMIVCWSYLINAVKDSYATALGSIGKVKLTLVAGLIGMGLNTLLNYAWIEGHFGFPAYGLTGAAWATVVASGVATLILLGYIYIRKYILNAGIKELFGFNYVYAKRVYRTTGPLVLHEGMWSLGNTLYAVAFGYLGVAALAAYQLAKTFNNFFRIGVSGFAFAARVMIGKLLGKEQMDEAIQYAEKFTKLSIYSSLVLGVLMIIFNPVLVHLFANVSGEVETAFSNMLYIQAVVLIVNFVNNVWIVGVFRPGGDNVYTMKLIIATTWLVALPLVFFGAYVMKWPVEVVYFLFCMEEIVKSGAAYYRYKSRKWARNLLKEA